MEAKVLLLDVKDPEIVRAFKVISPEDPVMYNKQWGECLQYHGTVIEPIERVEYSPIAGELKFLDYKVYHSFRHRAVPETNERKYWNIPASLSYLIEIGVR